VPRFASPRYVPHEFTSFSVARQRRRSDIMGQAGNSMQLVVCGSVLFYVVLFVQV
jgi:hypothetical protein